MVEFAFVLPIMLAFVMGLVTYGLTEAGDNTASSAVREGARVGILSYESAHLPGSAGHEAIVAAVDRHMESGLVSNFDVTVQCMRAAADGSISPVEGSGTCDPDVVVRGRDLIQVSVEWDPIGPVERPRRSELARMTVVGRPHLTESDVSPPVDDDPNDELPPEYQVPEGEEETEAPTPPAGCEITAVTLHPNPVRIKNNGQLHRSVVYRAETNGGTGCGVITFHWPANSHDEATTTLTPHPEDGAYIGSLPQNSGDWHIANNRAVEAVATNGARRTLYFDAVAHNR